MNKSGIRQLLPQVKEFISSAVRNYRRNKDVAWQEMLEAQKHLLHVVSEMLALIPEKAEAAPEGGFHESLDPDDDRVPTGFLPSLMISYGKAPDGATKVALGLAIREIQRLNEGRSNTLKSLQEEQEKLRASKDLVSKVRQALDQARLDNGRSLKKLNEVLIENENLRKSAPAKQHYYLRCYGGTELGVLGGPYADSEERDVLARAHRRELDQDDSVFWASIEEGALKVGSFTAVFMQREDEKK